MISLRGLTDHTLKNYCTYIRAYLDYFTNILHKSPEDVSWDELRDYIRWLQKFRDLSDRTVNCAISQLRFFTLYVLHKPWDDTQLPMRKFDTYLPYVLTRNEVQLFLGSLPTLKQKAMVATVYKGNIIKNLIMDCQSYTKYRPNETTGGIFVSWRRKEELPTGA